MIIDGKQTAKNNELLLKEKVDSLYNKFGRVPSLTVILVGEEPASMAYVTSKKKACERVGIKASIERLDSSISEDELIKIISRLNNDDSVDGILVQLPLPKHMNETVILNTVSPNKDVDGLHTINAGKLFSKQPGIRPATPLGIMMLLETYQIPIEGKHAVIVGRSNLVGMPIGKLLLDQNASVTFVHSKTKNMKELTLQADILVVAIGKANYIDDSYVKEGAVVIDVGINRVLGKLVGDVDFNKVVDKASYITPVPGGVGPMTISALLFNVIKQYEAKYDR
jgi:methylenetetrahydrofolate dehydrogenase (NADP+)/methenyltetrahydrofolate cyclohydrolase